MLGFNRKMDVLCWIKKLVCGPVTDASEETKRTSKVRPTVNFRFEGPGRGQSREFSVFIIRAVEKAGGFGCEVGRIVAEYSNHTKTCYIFDIKVEAAYQRQGIAEELLRQAIAVGQSEQIALVNVTGETPEFWPNLLRKGAVPIRFGLVDTEFSAFSDRYRSQPSVPTPSKDDTVCGSTPSK